MYQTQVNQKSFKEQFSLEERQKRCQQKLSQHPEMIPVILEKHPRSKMPQLNKQLGTLKNTLQISQKQSIFFHIGNQLLPEDVKLADIYEDNKDPGDGFLYITYSDLEVFG
ncbi:unnamed protein product [Paramecium sonneborni]|uniref:Autophagy-related protein n=1 Tax=Paramecium sonneborni TaxID=65129 RepID=A0A8S1MQP3_9CILI|nr:unnamed protein product [Paramecium sonneborni]